MPSMFTAIVKPSRVAQHLGPNEADYRNRRYKQNLAPDQETGLIDYRGASCWRRISLINLPANAFVRPSASETRCNDTVVEKMPI